MAIYFLADSLFFLLEILIISAITIQFFFIWCHVFSDLEIPETFYYIGSIMNVICIEEEAFHTLIDGVIKYVKSQMESIIQDKWVGKKEAMRLLRIKSPTTLQKLRDEGKIRFSQPERKHIVYDRDSINDYLEAYAIVTFNDK